jgi:hypothetical protein
MRILKIAVLFALLALMLAAQTSPFSQVQPCNSYNQRY